MRQKKINARQLELKAWLFYYFGEEPFNYDDAKDILNVKSFDGTFNALLVRGHLDRVINDSFMVVK